MPGNISLSATKGLNCVATRPSGRIGGVEEREVWRYESSAGERRTCWSPEGAIFLFRPRGVLMNEERMRNRCRGYFRAIMVSVIRCVSLLGA